MVDDKETWKELNQRSRWYSSQLWYVPFAYIGIVGLGVEKLHNLPHPLGNLAYLMLALFSLAVFVHVSSLKFYERRAVLNMQKLENPVVSGGGASWYMSFASYMKLMLMVGSYAFAWSALTNSGLPIVAECALRIAGITALSLAFALVWSRDRDRNIEVIAEIRKNMDC
ncbi:MAG: hypothetical protein NTW12_13010 [Deltaproteobacteria bacterium]|nr:hypothetical protein [Deltaproteobacteria bacterium]